jgi:hypothetical protein
LKTANEYATKAASQLKNNCLKAEIVALLQQKAEDVEFHSKAINEFNATDLSSGSPSWGKQLVNQ